MKFMASPRFLTMYSGVLTAIFATTILGGFAGPAKKSTFGEIYVQRINIVEPDGTVRMVLSSKSRAPGLIIKGKEYPREDRKTAGVAGDAVFRCKRKSDNAVPAGHRPSLEELLLSPVRSCRSLRRPSTYRLQ